MATEPGRAPVIKMLDGFPYPHGGARIGPAWGYAWNTVFGEPVEVLRSDAVEAVIAEAGLAPSTVLNIIRQATREGLLKVTRRKSGRARIPYLMRADWYYAKYPHARPKAWSLPPQPWPEWAEHTEPVS